MNTQGRCINRDRPGRRKENAPSHLPLAQHNVVAYTYEWSTEEKENTRKYFHRHISFRQLPLWDVFPNFRHLMFKSGKWLIIVLSAALSTIINQLNGRCWFQLPIENLIWSPLFHLILVWQIQSQHWFSVEVTPLKYLFYTAHYTEEPHLSFTLNSITSNLKHDHKGSTGLAKKERTGNCWVYFKML